VEDDEAKVAVREEAAQAAAATTVPLRAEAGRIRAAPAAHGTLSPALGVLVMLVPVVHIYSDHI
jgi:hypothetical protein